MGFLIFAAGLITGLYLGVFFMCFLSLASREPLYAVIDGPDPFHMEESHKTSIQEVEGLEIKPV